eukprot:TRINITY_DN1620_c0_g3_i1.p1 TRINITY_DN1620_c0_g3~~TRINITY_DN1620_c0_g3_i1.p1  ORF type:complete len:208 (+),score=33.99 TRINITY_DN1620_c0_g3_i1:454-1077(+)
MMKWILSNATKIDPKVITMDSMYDEAKPFMMGILERYAENDYTPIKRACSDEGKFLFDSWKEYCTEYEITIDYKIEDVKLYKDETITPILTFILGNDTWPSVQDRYASFNFELGFDSIDMIHVTFDIPYLAKESLVLKQKGKEIYSRDMSYYKHTMRFGKNIMLEDNEISIELLDVDYQMCRAVDSCKGVITDARMQNLYLVGYKYE